MVTRRTRKKEWRLSIHKKAKDEMDDLRYNHPATFDDFLSVLDILAELPDPEHANIRGFKIDRLKGRLSPWLRGKFTDNHVQWRFILRQLQGCDGGPVREIEYELEIRDDAEIKVLQIVMVTNRDGRTYSDVNKRFDVMHYG